MDVGLNNRNTLGEIAPELGGVVFLVEANSNEQHQLWCDWSYDSMTNIEPLSKEALASLSEAKKSWPILKQIEDMNHKVRQNNHTRIEWEQISSGLMLNVGEVKIGKKKLPVNVTFSFAIIEGKKVCFYECVSRMADYTMIEKWLIKRFQLTHDGYTRWNHVNAQNFHNCVNSLNDLDEKPRNTKYTGDR